MQLDPPRLDALKALSRQVSRLLELRRVSNELSLQLRDRQWYEQQLHDYQAALETQNADLAEQTPHRCIDRTAQPSRVRRSPGAEMEKARASGHYLWRGGARHRPLQDDQRSARACRGRQGAGRACGDAEVAVRRRRHGGALRRGGVRLLLPGSDAGQARLQCEFLRQSVPLLPIGVPITVSIGVAEIRRRDDTPDDAFRRADQALYAAKRAGRDRVAVAP
jgi:hypothetical protein